MEQLPPQITTLYETFEVSSNDSHTLLIRELNNQKKFYFQDLGMLHANARLFINKTKTAMHADEHKTVVKVGFECIRLLDTVKMAPHPALPAHVISMFEDFLSKAMVTSYRALGNSVWK